MLTLWNYILLFKKQLKKKFTSGINFIKIVIYLQVTRQSSVLTYILMVQDLRQVDKDRIPLEGLWCGTWNQLL